MTIRKQQVDTGTSGASRKIALGAGSLSALAALPGSALAALVTVTGSPVFVGTTGTDSATWDIDGNGSSEFTLTRLDSTYFTGSTFVSYNEWNLDRTRDLVGMKGPLRVSNRVDPGDADFNPGQSMLLRGFLSYFSSVSSTTYTSNFLLPVSGYALGDNLIGFTFDSGTGQYFGWATVSLDSTGVTIKNWTYDNSAGTGMHVGDRAQGVPEPSSLALLALGVGGLAALRSRKRKQAQSSV